MTRTILIASPFANLANIERALRAAGAEVEVTGDPSRISGAGKVVLPGVGSFAAAMAWLRDHGTDGALRAAVAGGASLLGICVGHQLLFDVSYEMGTTAGLGLVRGEVRRFETLLPVPQIGWNRVRYRRAEPLFAGIESGTPFYFVNSFAVTGCGAEVASAEYGRPFAAAVRCGRIFGVQFHPEKSSGAGLRLLRNFLSWN